MLVLGVWGFIGVAGIVGYYAVKLPQSTQWSVPDRPPNAKILAVNGELIANRGITGGEAVRLDEMSPYLPMAVIAIEDRRFKSHFGFDPIGFTRAMVTNLMAGRAVQGGSTITQQLAKNLFLEPERTIDRKIQELILSFWLETKFTKDEILELYLNRVYFGSGAYGVDAAARRYFGKSARDVNLAEAAMIAGLLKAPSRLSPARDPKAAEARAQVVLHAMEDSGFVTDREVTTALSMEAKKAKRYWSGSEHYVADMVMKELPELIGEMRKDVVVDTTVDLFLQKKAGVLVHDAVAENRDSHKVTQGALVAMDGTGAIRALVGGAEYADSQFNRAVDANRQPGSAFKPFVYLAAIENGRTPDTVRVDRKVKIGKWAPENYDHKYRGPVTLAEGLAWSLNTISAQLISEIGPKQVQETAARMGIRSPIARNASIALGTSEVTLEELTSAYAPFANGGYLAEPWLIRRVTTLDGKVLYERKQTEQPKVLASAELGMMNSMLQRVVEDGTGKKAQVDGWQIAGKTGTTQNSRDALFVGYSANLVTGVWFGNDDGTPMKKVTGGSLPAETFGAFMTVAHKGVPSADLPGIYLPPQVSIVPERRPAAGGGNPAIAPVDRGVLPQSAQNEPSKPVRRPLDEFSSTPRPSGTVGGNQRAESGKPRNILDILLGG
jgi:penicillin-binding protein 1A